MGRMDDQPHQDVPKPLIPTGSVDRILFLGGKQLTVFQSVGLVVIGVCVAVAIGGSILVNELI
jgi:hypothetical protein